MLERDAVEHLEQTRKGVVEAVAEIDKMVYDLLEVPGKRQEDIATGLRRLREQRRLSTRGLRVEEEE